MPFAELPHGGTVKCLLILRDKQTKRVRYDCALSDSSGNRVAEGKFSEVRLHHDVPMGLWIGRNRKGRNGFATYIVPRTTCRTWRGEKMVYPRLICTSDSEVFHRPIPRAPDPVIRPPPEDRPPAFEVPLPESRTFRARSGL